MKNFGLRRKTVTFGRYSNLTFTHNDTHASMTEPTAFLLMVTGQIDAAEVRTRYERRYLAY